MQTNTPSSKNDGRVNVDHRRNSGWASCALGQSFPGHFPGLMSASVKVGNILSFIPDTLRWIIPALLMAGYFAVLVSCILLKSELSTNSNRAGK